MKVGKAKSKARNQRILILKIFSCQPDLSIITPRIISKPNLPFQFTVLWLQHSILKGINEAQCHWLPPTHRNRPSLIIVNKKLQNILFISFFILKCKNDETRSMIIDEAEPLTIITVYDSPEGQCGDSYRISKQIRQNSIVQGISQLLEREGEGTGKKIQVKHK